MCAKEVGDAAKIEQPLPKNSHRARCNPPVVTCSNTLFSARGFSIALIFGCVCMVIMEAVCSWNGL